MRSGECKILAAPSYGFAGLVGNGYGKDSGIVNQWNGLGQVVHMAV